MDNQLIFIICQPRSGSTLLQTILSNHVRIDSFQETWFLLPLLSIHHPDLMNPRFDGKLAHDAFFDFVRKGTRTFSNGLAAAIRDVYSSHLTAPNNYFLDKTPRYYELIDEIKVYLPSAKLLYLKRNPIDVLESIRSTWGIRHPHDFWAYERDILHAPLFINEAQVSMTENELVVEYEELVNHPTKTIQRVCKWLQVDFDKEILELVPNQYELGDQNINSRQTIDTLSVDKWKSEATPGSKWRGFIKGYLAYLNERGLQVESNLSIGNTSIFDDFVRYCQLRNETRDSFSVNLMRALHNIKYHFTKFQ